MGDYQITCINKPDPRSPHERITHIGNGTWRLTLETAIALIDSKQHTFYTLVPNALSSASILAGSYTSASILGGVSSKRAEILVVRPGLVGHFSPYLRTMRDGTYTDNLLALPQCSVLTPIVTYPF